MGDLNFFKKICMPYNTQYQHFTTMDGKKMKKICKKTPNSKNC